MNENVRTVTAIKSWCKAHSIVVDEVIRRMIGIGVPPHKMRHMFSEGDDEEFIVYDNVGYHIEKEVDVNEGTFAAHAVPGGFVSTASGLLWKNGRQGLHDAIDKKFADKSNGIFLPG